MRGKALSFSASSVNRLECGKEKRKIPGVHSYISAKNDAVENKACANFFLQLIVAAETRMELISVFWWPIVWAAMHLGNCNRVEFCNLHSSGNCFSCIFCTHTFFCCLNRIRVSFIEFAEGFATLQPNAVALRKERKQFIFLCVVQTATLSECRLLGETK